jgi:ribonuclease HII
MPDFSIESSYEHEIICGVDEAGLGAWAGPLVVASCLFLDRVLPQGLLLIDDSKKLTRPKRECIFEEISSCPGIRYKFSVIGEEIIYDVGLVGAWRKGVVESVSSLGATVCLLDGIRKASIPNIKCVPIVKGDQKSFSIAAASIIAKVTRDRIMQGVHREFPVYGFDRNVGYGTSEHMKSISKFGICKRHRKNYAPIRKFMQNNCEPN